MYTSLLKLWLSAWVVLAHGAFDYNHTFLAPPGTQVLVHENLISPKLRSHMPSMPGLLEQPPITIDATKSRSPWNSHQCQATHQSHRFLCWHSHCSCLQFNPRSTVSISCIYIWSNELQQTCSIATTCQNLHQSNRNSNTTRSSLTSVPPRFDPLPKDREATPTKKDTFNGVPAQRRISTKITTSRSIASPQE